MIGQITFPAMGCQMTAVLDTPDPQAVDVLHDVPGWFAAWEQRFSRFRPDSELSWVNRQAGNPVRVSQMFADVFEQARQAAAWTGGLVTPAVHDAVLAAGYRKSFQDLPLDTPGEAPPGFVPAWELIGWDTERRVITLPPGLRLDFGGSAKGWAAEQAVSRLQAFGEALVDAGGDVAMSTLNRLGDAGGSRRREPWLVGVAQPFEPEALAATLALWGGGVATSGRDRRRWKQAGAWKHHLIDPRSGQSAETDVLTATVIAPSLAQAEAAAKFLLLSGSLNGLAWVEQQPQLGALLILETGSLLCSANFSAFEWKEHEDAIQK